MKKNTVFKAVGIMSGTSLDGLDIAYTEFKKNKGKWTYNTKVVTTIEYADDIKNKFKKALKMPGAELSAFDAAYGLWIGEQVKNFIEENKLEPGFIASHGHTIFHQPDNNFTLQIGDGSSIHAITQIPVIYNFRKLDVALGGQGAPLVPVGDALLFSDYNYCINLGGIANITKNTADKEVLAYDICPANMVLNHLAQRIGASYDNKGETAAKGKLLEPLLKELEDLSYYKKDGPKSLGYEYISEHVFPLLSEDYVVEDLLHTYCHHIAKMVAAEILKLNGKEGQKVLISGGGAYNDYLISLLENYCKPVSIEVPDQKLLEHKESIIFAFLGVLRLEGENNVWSRVTGASRDSCSGTIVGTLPENS